MDEVRTTKELQDILSKNKELPVRTIHRVSTENGDELTKQYHGVRVGVVQTSDGPAFIVDSALATD
jgi:hypothetical protein